MICYHYPYAIGMSRQIRLVCPLAIRLIVKIYDRVFKLRYSLYPSRKPGRNNRPGFFYAYNKLCNEIYSDGFYDSVYNRTDRQRTKETKPAKILVAERRKTSIPREMQRGCFSKTCIGF